MVDFLKIFNQGTSYGTDLIKKSIPSITDAKEALGAERGAQQTDASALRFLLPSFPSPSAASTIDAGLAKLVNSSSVVQGAINQAGLALFDKSFESQARPRITEQTAPYRAYGIDGNKVASDLKASMQSSPVFMAGLSQLAQVSTVGKASQMLLDKMGFASDPGLQSQEKQEQFIHDFAGFARGERSAEGLPEAHQINTDYLAQRFSDAVEKSSGESINLSDISQSTAVFNPSFANQNHRDVFDALAGMSKHFNSSSEEPKTLEPGTKPSTIAQTIASTVGTSQSASSTDSTKPFTSLGNGSNLRLDDGVYSKLSADQRSFIGEMSKASDADKLQIIAHDNGGKMDLIFGMKGQDSFQVVATMNERGDIGSKLNTNTEEQLAQHFQDKGEEIKLSYAQNEEETVTEA